MRIFGSERMDSMLQKLGLKEGEAIVHPWINKALERAQKKVEARNFETRKNLLKYDDVLNDQRKVIFDQRLELMEADNIGETAADMRNEVIETLVAKHIPENAYAEQWDIAGLKAGIAQFLNLDLPVEEWAKEEGIAEDDILQRVTEAADKYADERAERFGPEIMTYVERSVILQTIDHLWREHIVNLDHLRSVVGFRGYAQRDPLQEYKAEAFELFQALLANLREGVTAQLMRVELAAGTAAAGTAGNDRTSPRPGHGRRRDVAWRTSRAGCFRAERGAIRKTRHLGPYRPQRNVPLRFGQEIQALPRRLRTGLSPVDQK